MPEEHFLLRFKEALADEIKQAGSSAAGIDRVEQNSFMAGKEQDSFFFCGGYHAVTSGAIGVIYKDFFRAEAGFKLQ